VAVTYYVALPFTWDFEGRLVPGEAKQCPTARSAAWHARRLAETAAGAVAFSRTGDPAIGEFADAVVIESFGEVQSLDDLIDANV
jgi:hypothetical protein